jgi:hypothetical protein
LFLAPVKRSRDPIYLELRGAARIAIEEIEEDSKSK